MLLANDLIYGHRMQCGTNATSTRLLQLPRLKECHGGIAPGMPVSLNFKFPGNYFALKNNYFLAPKDMNFPKEAKMLCV